MARTPQTYPVRDVILLKLFKCRECRTAFVRQRDRDKHEGRMRCAPPHQNTGESPAPSATDWATVVRGRA
jgi:hypothetical protein